MKLKILLPSFAVCLLLLGCFTEKSSANDLKANIQKHFGAKTEAVLLRDLTLFEWEKACIFYADDSEKYSSYETYNDFIRSKNFLSSQDDLKKDDYPLIVVYEKNGQLIKVEPMKEATISLEKREYALTPIDKNNDTHSVNCFEADNAKLSIVQSDQYPSKGYIFIYNKEYFKDGKGFYIR